jgi:hypothetical protein
MADIERRKPDAVIGLSNEIVHQADGSWIYGVAAGDSPEALQDAIDKGAEIAAEKFAQYGEMKNGGRSFGMRNWSGSKWEPKGPDSRPWAPTDPSKANLN